MHVQRATTTCCATGARTPWPGPRTTWRSCSRWRPSAAWRCRRPGLNRELCRVAQTETLQARRIRSLGRSWTRRRKPPTSRRRAVGRTSRTTTARRTASSCAASQGQYSLKDELARLRAMPRVRKGSDDQVQRRPADLQPPLRRAEGRHHADASTCTSRNTRPGGRSQKHGHVNEAAFYILDGEGYEIHDGVRYDWKAGDVAIVHNNCVHQHFNAEPDQAGARARDQDQADVHVHEHAVPEAGGAAPDRAGARAARASRRARTRTTSTTRGRRS